MIDRSSVPHNIDQLQEYVGCCTTLVCSYLESSVRFRRLCMIAKSSLQLDENKTTGKRKAIVMWIKKLYFYIPIDKDV